MATHCARSWGGEATTDIPVTVAVDDAGGNPEVAITHVCPYWISNLVQREKDERRTHDEGDVIMRKGSRKKRRF